MQAENFLAKHKIILSLSGITALILFPFLTKPFHIDDPMFIWVAQHIQNQPLDFYGFSVNWYLFDLPMAEANKNPPLISYYIAAMATIFGWSELALHFVFLLPAVMLVIGVYRLSELLNANPVGAALSVLAMPVFLVSSTSVMADGPTTALWVWSVYYWVLGLKQEKNTYLYLGAIFAALAGLTKFVGISVIPLLAAYTVVKSRHPRNLVPLALPVTILIAYHVLMFYHYNQSIFADIVGYSANSPYRTKNTISVLFVSGLVFLGGSIMVPLCYLYPLFRKKQLLIILISTIVVTLSILYFGKIGVSSISDGSSVDYNGVVHGVVFIVVGIAVLSLPFIDFHKQRNAESILLWLWVYGVFIFACFVNWNTNARALLPMIPAVSILIWRQLQMESVWIKNYKMMLIPLVPVFLLSLALAWVDQKQAAASQIAADVVSKQYRSGDNTLWFMGTWGFQYYMEQNGAKKLNLGKSLVKKNDFVVVPNESSAIVPLPSPPFQLINTINVPISDYISVLSYQSKAGFYMSSVGVFPFRLFRSNPGAFHIVSASDDWFYVKN